MARHSAVNDHLGASLNETYDELKLAAESKSGWARLGLRLEMTQNISV